MSSSHSDLPADYPRIKRVRSFEELVTTPFGGDVNALCWERTLTGDFGEAVERLGIGLSEGITTLEDRRLRELSKSVSDAGRMAIEVMLEDLRMLRERGLAPELNAVNGYLQDENPGAVRTDVGSFHADRATAEADTWLCTYHGAPSEGLRHDEAVRRVDVPETRAELWTEWMKEEGGGLKAEDHEEAFHEWLSENCYDLHYAPMPEARPFSFGVGNLWRIAVEWPGCPVPPCVHRAPPNRQGQTQSLRDEVRLLLIS